MFRSRLLVPALLLLVPATALAQTDEDRSTARALGEDGQDALTRKDFARAADRFHRAVAIFDAAKAPVPPTLLIGLARADAATGHYVSAQEAYNRVIHQGAAAGSSPVFLRAIEDAKTEIGAVSPKIAWVTISVAGCAKPVVTVDGAPVPSAALGIKRPVDPGTHEVKATAEGCKDGQASFTVAESAATTAAITLEKDPSAIAAPVAGAPAGGAAASATVGTAGGPPAGADEGQKGHFPGTALAITSFAVGGAGLALGAITGGLALGAHSTLAGECNPDGTCPPSAKGDLDSFHTLGTLSTVGFVVGGVGAVAGLVFLIVSPKSTAARSAWVLPVIGPGSVGAVGRF